MELKKQVLSASGIKSIGREECRTVSIKVFTKDRNYLSESTIQSFLGLQHHNYVPTLFVLDSLAKYIGYTGWHDFKKQLTP
jgi:hypothetical protein